jgi:hypothetical protein
MATLLASGCDHGFAPPDVAPPGRIVGTVSYTGSWPPADSMRDLRFVAMRFMPQDTVDFLRLNEMAISAGLRRNVESDTFSIAGVDPGAFVYAGIAHQFDANLLSWRPLGLVEDDGGIFFVESGADTPVHVDVDFSRLPVFPPPSISGRR